MGSVVSWACYGTRHKATYQNPDPKCQSENPIYRKYKSFEKPRILLTMNIHCSSQTYFKNSSINNT